MTMLLPLETGINFSDEFILRVIFPLSVIFISTLVFWAIREVRRFNTALITLNDTLTKFSRLLYGEKDIEEWEGLIRMCVNTKRGEIQTKQGLVSLMKFLIREKIIIPDDDLKDTIDKLKDR